MSTDQKRLVRIDHIRCGDWGDATTYVLAPVEWDEEEVDRRATLAQDEYLVDFSAAQVIPKGAPPRPPYQPDFKNCDPSLAVGEVWAQHNAAKANFDKWNSSRLKVSRKFEDYLRDQGFTAYWEDHTLSVSVNWGHAHGQSYEYGTDDMNANDLRSPLSLATGSKDEEED